MPRQDTPAKPARRQYAEEFKRELVERCLQPGASVSGIALDNGINANVLFRWRRQHLAAMSGAARAVLLPVQLAAVAAPAGGQPVHACARVSEGVIEIDIGSARVRLHGSVDEASLRCVLHTLRAAA